MSALTLKLNQKTLRVEVTPETQLQRLSFSATLPSQDRLRTNHGTEINSGYVEFGFEKPRHSEPTLYFVEETTDPHTGKTDPESFSFYAQIKPEIYNTLRDAPSASIMTLRLHFELKGAIQFGDIMGFEKIWDTKSQKILPVKHFDLVVSYPESGA